MLIIIKVLKHIGAHKINTKNCIEGKKVRSLIIFHMHFEKS